MADITLRDLLHWDRTLTFRAPAGTEAGEEMDRPVTWAVAIRAASPILPTLRGGEIVIAPPKLLEQIRQTEMVSGHDLARMLADQPIAALMVDPTFDDEPVPGVPLLVTRGQFPQDAESTLNRVITERRAELYRLGSDLSRALSTATMIGSGLDTLLDAAEAAGGRPLVLQSTEGSVVASSQGADLQQVISAQDCVRLAEGHLDNPPVELDGRDHSRRWLAQLVGPDGARRIGARGAILSMSCPPDTSTEIERLILERTGEAVAFVLRQVSEGASHVRDRLNRESLVADLLLGRLVSREAADARSRLLGLDPVSRTRVALFTSRAAGLSGRVRSALAEERGRAFTAITDEEYAIILTSPSHVSFDARDLAGALRSMRASDQTLLLAISEPVDGTANARTALDQVRVLVRLARSGAVNGTYLNAEDIEQVGIYSLFLGLAHGPGIDHVTLRARLDSFAGSLLRELEDHDRARGSELVATLDAYLRHGGALAQAADALDIHRNTLSYRLGRISDLTGRNLNDPRSRFLLQIALSVRALAKALST